MRALQSSVTARHNGLCALLLAAALLAGCATRPAGIDDKDPWQPFNRQIYEVNDVLDQHFMKPIASAYLNVTPAPVARSVNNFFNNVTYPNVLLNDALQLKLSSTIMDIGRFTINSTIGVLGLFDPATALGLPANNEDIGQTLAVWGVPQGPFLMMPFIGPDTVRNSPDLVVSTVTNILFYITNPYITVPLSVLGVINNRAQVAGAVNVVNQAALDPYVFIREGYLQRRLYLIYDGHPPRRLFDEFDPLDDPRDKGPDTP